MKFLQHPLLFIAVIYLSACDKTTLISSTIPLSQPYDTLVFADVFDVELVQDSLSFLEITGNPKFISHIKAELENNTLTVHNENRWRWLYPEKNKIRLTLHFNQLARIIANETCNIRSEKAIVANELGLVLKSKLNQAQLNLNCQTFYFWNNFPCGGMLKLSGTCHEVKLWNYALMQVNATELSSHIARIENASKGDIRMYCSDSLFYKIKGAGNIEVFGNPSFLIDLGSSGPGKLIVK
jgi:hypothetical protein